jgi:cytochrome b involved in lipid metabolism
MDLYDIVVVGGGMAGLNTCFELSKKNYSGRVLLIEGSGRFGGRVHTSRKTLTGKKASLGTFQYESGAGRLGKNQKYMMTLLKDLQLLSKQSSITNIVTPLLNPSEEQDLEEDLEKKEQLYFSTILNHVFKKSKKLSKHQLQFMTFKSLIERYTSQAAWEFLYTYYGYTAEFFHLNAYDALKLFKNDFHLKNKYFVLTCGFDKIYMKLVSQLKKNKNYTLMLEHYLRNITPMVSYNRYTKLYQLDIDTNNGIKKILANQVVCAIPQKQLIEVPYLKKSIPKVYLNSVQGIPLCRIYAIYPIHKKTGKVWFHSIGKVTVNSAIQYIIPIDYKRGLIMISYADKYADFWNKTVAENNTKLILHNLLTKQFPTKHIPNPFFVKVYHWPVGVHYFKKGVDSTIITKEMIHPIPNQSIYVCGEAFSNHQGWIEGALESSTKVAKYILKRKSPRQKFSLANIQLKTKTQKPKKSSVSNKKYTMTEVKKHNKESDVWIVIDDQVLDVTNWLKDHPGGKSIIMTMAGKNATEKFNSIPAHNLSIKKTLFPKFKIGVLKK